MAQKFTSFTPLEEAAPTFTSFTPIEEGAEKGERTWGEAATDIGASAVSGLGKLAQFPGQLYGLTTGAIKDKDFATTGMQGVGKEMQDWAKAQKSAELKRRETETQKKVQEAEKTGGQWKAFKTQLYESGTDPMQLGAFLAETAPASIPSIIAAFIPGAGPALAAEVKMLQIAAQAATTAATKQVAQQALGVAMKEAAKSAVKRGTTAAVGVGAVQQGTDVGAGAYKQVYDALIAKGVSPEQAAEQTINKARAAGAGGAVISLLAQLLPGGRAMERALAGEKGKLGRVAGAVVGGVKGTPSEIIEEVGGKGGQNVAARMVNPEQSLTEGLGATAAQAGIGGFGMGSTVGALQGRQALEAPASTTPGTTPGTTAAAPTAKQQARQDAVAQRAQQLEEQSGITADDAVRIAEDDIAAEEAKIAGLTTEAPNTRVEARAIELIDTGVKPEEAYATALQQVQEEIENDVLAKEQGAQDVTGIKPGTSGKRTAVVSKPAAGTTAAGPAAPTGVGVVPTGEDAGVSNVGKAAQPTAVGEGTNLGLTTIPYETVSFAGVGQPLQRSSGESNIIDYNGRKIVLVNVNGVQVPFYLSTGRAGKVDVPAGKWYPFFGIGSDGWINKTGGKEMADYYGSSALRDAAQTLDKQIGDVRSNDTHPRVSVTGPHMDAINAGLNPSENEMPDTLTTVRSNIDNLISKIKRTTDSTQAAQTQQTKTREQKAPAAPVAPAEFTTFTPVTTTTEPKPAKAPKAAKAPIVPEGPKVNIAAAQAATDPAEIQKHLADIETEGATLLSKDGRFPKKGTTKRVRLDEIGVLKRDLTAKLQPAVAEAEAPVVEAPVVEAPVVEAPVVETPVAEAPVAEAPAPTKAKAEKPDDWASFIDDIEQEVDQEIAEPDAIVGEPLFDQTQRQPWKARGVADLGRNIGAELTAELAEEKQKRRGFAETEAAAKAKEKSERATKGETAEAAETEPDKAAKARAGAVDVVERSLEIVGALQEVAGSTNFPAGTRTNARKYLAEIARANNENEAPEGSLEPAFLFLVDLASKPRFMRTGGNKSLPSIGKEKVQAIVDLVASRWKNAPTVVVADNINDAAVPAELQKADADAKAKGATGVPAGVFYQGKVYIFADQMKSTAETVRTLLHESLGHYGLRGVFGEDLKPILQLVAKNFKGEMDALATKYGLNFQEEADVMEAAEEILANLAQTKPTMGVVQRAIAAVRRFLRKIGVDVKLSNKDLIANYVLPARAFVENRRIDRAVDGAPGFSRTEEGENLTPEQTEVIKDTIRTQEEIDKAVAKAKFKFEESAKAQKAAKGVSVLQMATNPRKVIPAMRDLWKRATSAQRNLLVKIPPTSFLVDWAGNAVPELQNTYKLMQRMGGTTEQLLNAAGELTTEVQRAFQADPTLRGKLDELTSVATLAEVDPGMVDTIDRSDALDKAWKDLGPEGQRVYERIRNHFNVLSKYLSKLLDDQVNSLSIDAEAKANIMKKIRATFEKGSRINPYFPLVREGDFWLSMGSGETRTFFMAETAAERDRAAREFAAERIKRKSGESEAAFEKRIDDKLDELEKDSEFEMGDDITSLRTKTYSQGEGKMLTGVFDAIDSTNFTDPEAGGLLKDAIYQTFLETMPDQIFRKQFIHRKGVAGFRVDVLQNTAHLSARMATQLARIKYSPLLRNSLSAAKDSIRGRRALEPFVAEMAARVDSSLAPKAKSLGATVAGGLNKAAFIYYLSGASSALLQPLSLFQTGMPVLARYGAFKATREMSRMLKVWSQFGVYKTNADGSKSWIAPSILNAKDTTPLERKAYRAAAELGLFTSTQASSVFEYKATPTEELKGPKEKFARGTVDALVLGGLMNSSERMSREAMFMTSFRLNMEQHGNFTRAVSQATYDTNEALGDYGESNRPAFMKNSVGKVLTQFMMYPLHVTMFMLKNFKEMVKPMNGRSRAEASYKFFGTLGSTYVLAGATGLPMFSTVMGLLGAAWEELKDDDWDESMRSMGFEAWSTTTWLHDQLGENKIGDASLSDLLLRGPVNAFTGIDIAGRTSMNNLWTRESKEQKTIRESATAMALEKAGPAANMILSVADGVDAAMQGDYAKAVKKWAPAGFRNFVSAHELATEGAKDNKGAQIMTTDAFSTGALIAQAIGFRSDLLANTQYAAFKVIGAQQKILNEQNRLLENLDREFRNNNAAAYSKQIDKIADFNRRYPSFAMDMDAIGDSLEKRMERRGTAYMGVVPTEKNLILLDALRHSGRRVAEAERKGREQ